MRKVWTYIFGKPERLTENMYEDEYGCWQRNYTRANGTPMHFIPSPLELFRTKKECQDAIRFLNKAIKRCKCD